MAFVVILVGEGGREERKRGEGGREEKKRGEGGREEKKRGEEEVDRK